MRSIVTAYHRHCQALGRRPRGQDRPTPGLRAPASSCRVKPEWESSSRPLWSALAPNRSRQTLTLRELCCSCACLDSAPVVVKRSDVYSVAAAAACARIPRDHVDAISLHLVLPLPHPHAQGMAGLVAAAINGPANYGTSLWLHSRQQACLGQWT